MKVPGTLLIIVLALSLVVSHFIEDDESGSLEGYQGSGYDDQFEMDSTSTMVRNIFLSALFP